MAAKTYRLANSNAPNGGSYLDLLESDQGAATLSTGWTLGKTATTLDSPMVNGTEQGTGTFSLESGSPKPGTPSSNNGFRSDTPLNGQFDLAAWAFTIAFRSVTTAYSGTIRARVRVFKSANADGTGATELTGSTQIGTTSGVGSTTVDSTSVVTWTPGSSLAFNNEYLFITIACEIVTASGSNTADALLRTGTSTTGTFIVTGNFSVAEKNVPKKPQPLVRLNLKGSKPFLPHNNILVPDITKRQTVTLVGDVIVDNILPTTLPVPTINRLNPVQGDGIAYPDSSFGLWRGSTNLVPNGGFETDTSGWVLQNGGETRVPTNAKFGTRCLSWTHGGSPAYGIVGVLPPTTRTVVVSPNTIYTLSFWMAASSNYAFTGADSISISWYDSSDALISSTSSLHPTLSTSMNRFAYTNTSPTGAAFAVIKIFTFDSSANGITFYLDGIQLEQQAYATPYIETNGATASRNAGYVTAPSSVLNATQGWVAVRYRLEEDSSSASKIIASIYQDNSNLFNLAYIAGSGLAINALPGGTQQISAPLGNGTHTLILVWSGTTIKGSSDGNAINGNLSLPSITLNSFFIGIDAPASFNADGEFLWVAAGTGTLSDADAASINSKGDTDDPTNWPSLSAATFFWAANNDEWVVPSLATGAAYTESATVSSVTSPSASDVAAFVDQDTPAAITTPSTVETTQFVDSNTPGSVTSVSSVEYQTFDVVVPRPLLIGLERGKLKLLKNNILNPDDSVRVQYTDAATVSGISSVASAETSQFVDSGGAIQGTSSISSTESTDYVDSSTVTGLTIPSATDVAGDVESATVSGITSLSAVEVAVYVDADTPTSITNLSSADTANYVDTDTVTSITSVLYQEQIIPQAAIPRPLLIALERGRLKLLGNNILNPDQIVVAAVTYTDSATISSVTSVQSTDSTDFIDTSGTVQGTSSITSTEIAADVDSDTVAGISSLSSTETAQYVDSTTIGSVTTPSSTDIVAFIDSTTVNGVTTPSAVDVSAYVDASTTAGTTSLSTIETAQYVDSGTTAGTTSVTSTDIAAYIDGTTANGITTPSATDIAAFVDANVVNGVTTPSASETAQYVDAGSLSTVTSLTYTETTDYLDATIVNGVTTPSSVDTADYVDSGTVPGVTTVISQETQAGASAILHPVLVKFMKRRFFLFHNNILTHSEAPPVVYTDASTITSVTSISSVDTSDFVDANTVPSSTTPTSADTYQGIDANLISTTTSLSGSTDIYAAVDSATFTGTTSVTTQDIHSGADSSTTAGTTSISSADVAAYVDANSASSITSITSTDFAAYVDEGVASGTTTVSALEAKGYSDTDAADTTTSVSYGETAAYVDTQTATGITYITSQDVVLYLDQSTVPSSSTINSSEVAFYIDSSTLNTQTSVTYDEIYSHGGTDSAEIESTTSVIYTEERSVTDSNTIVGLSYVIYSDTSQYQEIATVTSRSTVIALEVQFFVELVGSAVTHFCLEVDMHYSATSTKHFTYESDNHYSCKAVTEFATT